MIDFFKLPMNAALVLVDEVALDFGQLRLKAKGSPGGHNGLKSVQAHLKTPEYTRLRIGVGGEKALCQRGTGEGEGKGSLPFYLLESRTSVEMPRTGAGTIEDCRRFLKST